MAARAITQIHTHRRNRHGSCRDGKGGAFDALALSESEVEGGADVVAPSESSKRLQAILEPPIAALLYASLEDASTADAAPAAGHNADALASPMTAHAPKPCTRRIRYTPHSSAMTHTVELSRVIVASRASAY